MSAADDRRTDSAATPSVPGHPETAPTDTECFCAACCAAHGESSAARPYRWLSFYAWKVWNRTRYYWPQAQSRKRAAEKLRRDAHALGFAYVVNVPWWWPFGGTGRFVDLRKDTE